jgi:hypothetical protein
MSRARDNANLGAQAGSGLDASDITSGALPVGVTGGSGLNALSASNLSAGVVPDARFPATLPAASGANLTALPAANVSGVLPVGVTGGSGLTALGTVTAGNIDALKTVYTISSGYPLENFDTGWGLSETDRFMMIKMLGIVFLNAEFVLSTGFTGTFPYYDICELTSASGLRPSANREIYGAVTGYGGDTAHSFQIKSSGQLTVRHADDADASGAFYCGINGFYLL